VIEQAFQNGLTVLDCGSLAPEQNSQLLRSAERDPNWHIPGSHCSSIICKALHIFHWNCL